MQSWHRLTGTGGSIVASSESKQHMSHRGPLQEQSTLFSALLRLLDALSVIATSVAAYMLRHGDAEFPLDYQAATIIGVLLTLIIFPRADVYSFWRGKSMRQHARALATGWIAVGAILSMIAFATKTSEDFSRAWMILWMLGEFGTLLTMRLVMSQIASFIRKKGWEQSRIVIIGEGSLGQEVAHRLAASPWLGVHVVAMIDARKRKFHPHIQDASGKSDFSDLRQFVHDEKIDEVWIASPLRAEIRVRRIIYALRDSTVALRFVPDIFGAHVLKQKINSVAGLPVVDLIPSPMVGINRVLKAIEDRVLALVILVVISPLLILLAIGAKLSSPGPIIFRQRRHGWDGTPFTLYKFRTMVVHSETDDCVTQAYRNDPRVTRFGAFLRRTSLDELPQLINVLQGHMSLVGPRPHALSHNEYYKELIELYGHRGRVKPGITGWAQVNGFRGETDALEKIAKRVEYDLYYIANWSLWFDLKIIILTLFKGFYHQNAY
jgi:putative colanic acid biosynthesis UDP-glucose lipid carrier transferase